MPDSSIDAIKIAKAIQKDELSILRGKEFKFRDKIKKRKRMKKTGKEKMTLAKLAKIVSDGFKRIDNRIDNLEKDVNSLKQGVKGINVRLDYNGLKKLPESNK